MACAAGCGLALTTDNHLTCFVEKCQQSFHFECVGISPGSVKLDEWVCPGCVCSNKKGGNNSSTPVRGIQQSSNPNVTLRNKQTKRTEQLPQSPSLDVSHAGNEDIKEFTKEIRLLREELQLFRTQIYEITVSLSKCHDKVDAFNSRLGETEMRVKLIEERELENQAHKKYIGELEAQLNFQCQELLRNELEISGIPEKNSENLHHTVLVAAKKLGVDLTDNDIDNITRVGARRPDKESYHRNVVVKLVRRGKRDEFLKAAKSRRSLTTEHLEFAGPPTRVFFNERLTRSNRLLFRETRKKAKLHNFRHCWTSNGSVYVRKREGSPALLIKTKLDIDRIFPDIVDIPCVPENQHP